MTWRKSLSINESFFATILTIFKQKEIGKKVLRVMTEEVIVLGLWKHKTFIFYEVEVKKVSRYFFNKEGKDADDKW